MGVFPSTCLLHIFNVRIKKPEWEYQKFKKNIVKILQKKYLHFV